MNKKRALKVLEMFLDKQCSIERTLNHMYTTDVEIWDAVYTATKALSAEPCREADDYENEIADLHNSLDIAEYDKERLREEVTVLEEKLKAISAEPCEDAISRQAVLSYIEFILTHGMGKKKSFEFIKKYVEKQPSVTPKQKMGRWIKISPAGIYECSECGQNVMTGDIDAYRHCHGCGAKMSENPTGSTPEKEEEIGPDKKG